MKTKINTEFGTLYHYTSTEIFLEKILPKFHLKLAPISGTNDPRENRTYSFALKNATDTEDIDFWIHKEAHFAELVRQNVKVCCFSKDYKINNCPFSGFNLPRMWAQYGDKHKGVCIEINTEKLISENKDLFNIAKIKSVKYQSKMKPPTVDQSKLDQESIKEYAMDFRNKNLDFLFFTKFIDWKSEHEVRILFFDKKDGDQFFSIKNSISRIILGIDFNKVYTPSIQKYVDYDKIEKIQFENGQLLSKPITKKWILSPK